VKKKQDKIDGLFKDYFSGGSKRKYKVSDAHAFDMKICACDSVAFREAEMPYGAKTQCPDAVKLGAYIDGTLDQKEKVVLDEHIAGCAKCSGLVKDAGAAISDSERGDLPEVPFKTTSEDLYREAQKKPRKK
jgi:hypothetical protein